MSEQSKQAITVNDLRVRRDEILEIVHQYGASNVRVVGSVARGEATPESDIDLLINLPPRFSVFDLVGLWMEMKELLGRDLSIIPDSSDNHAFLQSVLEDAVPL